MPKFLVEVALKSTRQKELTVYAATAEEAEDKAIDIVLKWDGVDDAEVVDCTEE